MADDESDCGPRDNVLRMPGVSKIDANHTAQPQPQVIADLEFFLEEAKAGRIQAIAVAYVLSGHVTGDGWAIDPKTSDATDHDLMAAVTYLQFRLARFKNDDGERAPRQPRGA